ncbi:hypothetical protein, partial [Burkholderia pseudomallei]
IVRTFRALRDETLVARPRRIEAAHRTAAARVRAPSTCRAAARRRAASSGGARLDAAQALSLSAHR